MVAVGLILLLLGAIGILAGVLTGRGSAELLGLDVDAVALFLIGVASGAAVLWGFSILKFGTKRSLQRRRASRRAGRRSGEPERDETERVERGPDDGRHVDRERHTP